jgi:hypothetical protein
MDALLGPLCATAGGLRGAETRHRELARRFAFPPTRELQGDRPLAAGTYACPAYEPCAFLAAFRECAASARGPRAALWARVLRGAEDVAEDVHAHQGDYMLRHVDGVEFTYHGFRVFSLRRDGATGAGRSAVLDFARFRGGA